MDPRTVLSALADLAPAGTQRVYDVTQGGPPVAWLTGPDGVARGAAVDRLAALDALHKEARTLRLGWGFVLGSTELDGAVRRLCLPLVAQPVRLRSALRGYRVVPAGDVELSPLVDDPEVAAGLEAITDVTALPPEAGPEWLTRAAASAGLELDAIVAVPPARRRVTEDRLTGVAVAGLFVAREGTRTGLRDTLLAWAARPGLEATALAGVYRSDTPAPDPAAAPAPAAVPALAAARVSRPADGEPVVSPLPLNRDQREVVRRARVEPVVVVSGPPGNGKSHAVVAAAIDVVDRGGSVLVATQSGHAAEVLGELLARYPGPTPVLFGDAERRAAVATELAEGAPAGVDDRALRRAERAVESASAEVDRLEAAIGAALELEATAAGLDRWVPLLTALRSDAPGAFADGADLGRARRLLDRARDAGPGFWGRLRSRRAARQVRRLLGARAPVPDAQLDAAIEAARAGAAMARLVSTGGTDLAAAWTALSGADRALAEAVGHAMRDRGRSGRRWNAPARRSVGRLAAALRAGRGRRRELLAELPGRDLVSALPLWVGTVADVEDLLPPVPGLFDLVILDEASHVDQIRAAPVLARARRALIVGDPRQLRFVSFVADVDVAETLHRHGLDERVDVRRISAFDLAAGTAPVTWLAEHYRCAPHLIEFSAHRFYRDRIALTSRHPRNEAADVIDVRRVPDAKLVDGVCPAEVSAVVEAVRELVAAGGQGIGVVTPFRGQADALESALLAAFPVAEIERLGLRVGTVHAFQGSEAETVVASLGLTPDDPAGRRRFAADPNLFNVLVTRARRRMVVVTGLSAAEADGLIGEYLEYSERPPVPPGVDAPAGGWVADLAGELARSGTEVRVGYPVGPWTVDVCLGTGEDAVGLICAVHPDGPAAHLERQRTLARAGWRLVDAFATRWASDPRRAAVDLLATPLHNPPRPPVAPGSPRPAAP